VMHLNGQRAKSAKNSNGWTTVVGGSNWLGGRDSNPDTVVQSHVSYRWTTSQQAAA
jgi:hypothetical protein